ncbi:MAG: hypothetical protein ACE5MI_13245 [Acidimicrobiia bacterium]
MAAYRHLVPGRHAHDPWRELGPIRGSIAALGLFVLGIVRFFREGPEWLIGLLITAVAVAVFLMVAQ